MWVSGCVVIFVGVICLITNLIPMGVALVLAVVGIVFVFFVTDDGVNARAKVLFALGYVLLCLGLVFLLWFLDERGWLDSASLIGNVTAWVNIVGGVSGL